MLRSSLSRKFQPRLESLESRECPTVMCSLSGGTLQILGDQTDNSIDVSSNTTGVVDVVGDGATFHFTGVQNVHIATGDGNDTVRIRIDESSNQVSFKAKTDLGGGDNNFALQVTAAQVFVPNPGYNPNVIDVSAVGNVGNDHMSASITSSTGNLAMLVPAVKIAFDGGAGDDSLSMAMNGIILRHQLDVNFKGGDGNDTLTQDFHNNNLLAPTNLTYDGGNGDDTIDVRFDAAGLRSVYNAPVNLWVQGGAGNDNINFVLGGSTTPASTFENRSDPFNPIVNSAFNVSLDGGDGNDILAAKATVASQSAGKLTAKVLGGAGDDDLTLDVSNVPTSVLQSALIDGGDGFDTHHSKGNVTVINCEA